MAYINQYLLADPRLYREIKSQLLSFLNNKSFNIDGEEIKNITYASWQQRNYFWPDQVFHGHWKNFEKRKEEHKFWSLALLSQAARFHFDTDTRRLAIQSAKFDSWQSWISKQSGLPVIACQLNQMFEKPAIEDNIFLENALKNQIGFRAIVSPHHPLIEDFIERNGLHETHIHLNGTTLLEQLWHHALQHPELILKSLEEVRNKERVQLLYASIPHLSTPYDYFNLLKLARQLRELLLTWLYKEKKDYSDEKSSLYGVLEEATENGYFRYESMHFDKAKHWSHVAELHWQVQIQNKLKTSTDNNSFWDCCYLLYILSMNCYQRLLVQGSDQYGFDQFQKFADDGVREEIETEYMARFYQLHGPHPLGKPDLATLEARFAPKKTNEKNEKLIRNILIGFLGYAKGENKLSESADLDTLANEVLMIQRPKLRLVAHFIKQKWTPQEDGYYFQALRESLIDCGSKLIELLDSNPALKQIITGIDAAANELETPPEVFAPFYRYCKARGIKNFTYHVGEDFEHLVSGIRAVFDAVYFLELRNGDRIGHATAIGICPSLWLDTMPEKIFIKRSEWLNNLLFIRKIALSDRDIDSSILKLEEDILKVIDELKLDCNISVAQLAFDLRGLDPIAVNSYLSGDDIELTGWLNDEVQLVSEHTKESLDVLKARWYSSECLELGEQLIEVELSDTSVKLMVQLQQYVQNIISSRHVVIETLPTSNVRISHYKSINEHHLFRWLGIEERKFEGDSRMLITLGSDDPGIFATDMRNEVYHIFSALRHEFNLEPHSALQYIQWLNENGRIYHFDYENELIIDRHDGYAISN